jgi:hypothetical protein
MIAHLVGNGPSKAHFKNDPEGHIYGCNLGQPGLPMRAVFMLDTDVINHLDQTKTDLGFSVIAGRRLVRFINSNSRFRESPRPEVVDTINRDIRRGENTGHVALEWLLEHGYTEIHMWGFDSIRQDTVASDTHQKLVKCSFSEKLIKPWRETWDKLFQSEKAKGKSIFVHFDVHVVEKVV